MYVIDTINDGTLYLRGLCEEMVQIGRYTADHGVAFPDLLNTVDEGQLQHTKLCLLSSKTNRTILHEMVRGTFPTIVFGNSHAQQNYLI